MKDPRDEFNPYWLQTAVRSGGNGGILGQLAQPVDPPSSYPWPLQSSTAEFDPSTLPILTSAGILPPPKGSNSPSWMQTVLPSGAALGLPALPDRSFKFPWEYPWPHKLPRDMWASSTPPNLFGLSPTFPSALPPSSRDPSSPSLQHAHVGANAGFPAPPARPVVKPWNDPWPIIHAQTNPFALSPTLPSAPTLEHLDSGKYWPAAPAPSGASAQPPSPASWAAPKTPLEHLASAMAAWGGGETATAAPQPSPVTAAGLAKQASVGLGKGLIGLPGMLGDARDLGFNIGDWIGQKILDHRTHTDQQRLEQAHAADFTPGASARQRQQRYDEARKNLFATKPLLSLAPSSADIQGVIEQATGPFRKPENVAEEYIDTAGQFVPAIFGGGGGVVRRGAQWLVPALTSETAGQLTKGTEWEPAARFAGAIFGGAAPYFAHPSAPRGAAAPPPPRPVVTGDLPVAAPGVPERVTAYAPHEAVAGKGTEHLPGMIDQPYAVRQRYTNDARSSWANPETGGDALYEALGSRVLPSRPATGSFTPGGGPLEINPAHVARPTVDMTPGGAIGNESRKMLELGENLRAYVDFQNMGAAHTLTRNVPWEQRNSVNVPINRRIDPKEMEDLTNFAAPYGFHVSHRGHSPRGGVTDPLDLGVTFINKGEGGPSTKDLQTLLGRDLAPGIKKILPDAGTPELVKAEPVVADLQKLLVSDNEGKRLATEHIARMLADAPPGTIEALDRSRLLREMAAARHARDVEQGPLRGGVRKDAQRAREIIAERGFRGLIEAVQRKEVLPSVLASLGLAGAYEAGSPDE